MISVRIIAAALCLLAPLSRAALIVEAVDSGTANSLQLNLPGSPVTLAAAISWTQTTTFTNVNVSAYLFSEVPRTGGQAEQFTAYLTNNIGPGTTGANNVAAPFTAIPPAFVAPEPGTPTLLFSGLTLGPGTYYLVVQSHNTSPSGLLWESQAGLSPTFGAGVTGQHTFLAASDGSVGNLNLGFAPASVIPLTDIGGSTMYSVTGDAVPEPSTFAIAGIGLIALGAAMRRRTRTSKTL